MGCDRRYDPSDEEIAQENVVSDIQAFFRSGYRTSLKVAQRTATENRLDFLQCLIEARNLSAMPHEFDGFEYEVKFQADELSIDAIALPERYVSSRQPKETLKKQHYFRAGDDIITFSASGKHALMKRKSLPVYLGNVLKRREEIGELSAEELLNEISQTLRGGTYLGTLEKQVQSMHVFDTTHGRVFSIDFGMVRNGGSMYQLEVEYKGYIPGLDIWKGSEEQMLGDLDALGTAVQKSTGLPYTTEEKYQLAR